jgi:cysteinyl-tRNA synthetase
MSKSLGNFYTLRDLREKGYEPRSIRFLMLSAHYRKPLNFTFEALGQARAALERLDDLVHRLESERPPAGSDPALQAAADRARSGIAGSLDNDLNTAGAMGHLFDLVREVNTALDAGRGGSADLAAVRGVLDAFEAVTGIRAGQPMVADGRSRN